MGEKRAYNARKPGGGRKKLKPEYDAGENLKEQMDAAVALYEEDCSLQSIADALALNPIKVRKLLITAGVYESEVAEKVQDTFEEYRETQNYKEAILSTANTLQLSKASVTSYLPYQKGVYFPSTADKEKISVGAERQRRYRVIRKLRSEPTEEHLWETVLLYWAISPTAPLPPCRRHCGHHSRRPACFPGPLPYLSASCCCPSFNFGADCAIIVVAIAPAATVRANFL